jgi:phosphatidate cytidylyltransferase
MLKARVITALFLVAGLFAVLFLLPSEMAALVFAVITSLAAWEWAGLLKSGRMVRVAYAAFIFLACVAAGMLDLQVKLWWVAAGFWLSLAPAWLVFRWPIARNAVLGHGIGIVLLLPAWAGMVALLGRSPWLLLGVLGLVAVADIGAYFAGRKFGKHKLAPKVSPGKTWEGVAGGMLAVTIYVALVSNLVNLQLALGWLLLVALVLVAASIVGDLFESLVKREAGMKDSSQLLPGHGGVLDRVDSLTAALPLAALAMRWGGV